MRTQVNNQVAIGELDQAVDGIVGSPLAQVFPGYNIAGFIKMNDETGPVVWRSCSI